MGLLCDTLWMGICIEHIDGLGTKEGPVWQTVCNLSGRVGVFCVYLMAEMFTQMI